VGLDGLVVDAIRGDGGLVDSEGGEAVKGKWVNVEEQEQDWRYGSEHGIEQMGSRGREEGRDKPVENSRMALLPPISDDTDNDLCGEKQREWVSEGRRPRWKRRCGWVEEEKGRIARRTLPPILTPSRRLLPLAEACDILCEGVCEDRGEVEREISFPFQ
jgi:hypothetical protein